MSNLVQFPKSVDHCVHSSVEFDHEASAAILNMHPSPRPSFTPELLKDIESFQTEVARLVQETAGQRPAVRYTVLASSMPGIYNFGGDLSRFVELIRAGDRDGLLEYALACVRAGHRFAVGMDLPVTSISLVEGRAQGGGFEAALSCNVVIAEKGVQMGFPEVLFNLFPGMGAYSYLSRKISSSAAERLILSGQLYEAETLYEMGVVDVLAEPGEGRERLREFIKESERRNNVRGLMRRIRSKHNRVPFEELEDITQLWVDSAVQLPERDLRTMERLVRAQDRRNVEHARQAN